MYLDGNLKNDDLSYVMTENRPMCSTLLSSVLRTMRPDNDLGGSGHCKVSPKSLRPQEGNTHLVGGGSRD